MAGSRIDEKALVIIERVFDGAHESGRTMLYEFEVYAVLEALGLGVPQFTFVQDIHEVEATLLKKFHGSAVVKIVSPDLAHKSKFGGVKKIDSLDPLFVRFVLHNMKEEVLSHFPKGSEPRIDGFLISEVIPFTQALGNEILIGVMEDTGFGPIISLSKGGDDAEFFAKYYDAANLLIAPITMEEALNLVRSTKIRHKFDQFGQKEACQQIATALHAISQLASSFSFISEAAPKYHIQSMDVNPFVIAADGRFIAVDGYISFTPARDRVHLARHGQKTSIAPFFDPKGIVVAGVSSDMTKYSLARNIVQLLLDMKREDIYCLNPKGGEAEFGNHCFPLYKDLSQIEEAYNLLVYAAPAKNTLAFLETVPDNMAVILISGIPADLAYTAFTVEIEKHLKRGIRIVGPNCMGVFMAPYEGKKGINTLFIGENRLRLRYGPRSNMALITQSGGLSITTIERTQYAPILKTIVSFGNKVDVDTPDLMQYFADEPEVRAISMYLEGMSEGEGRRMFDAAKAIHKPIIVYKGGRTAAGAKAAASHTASMSGSYDVFQAACRQSNIILVDELADYYWNMKMFSMQADNIPNGNRVGGVVNAGLDATMGADTMMYLQQAVVSEQTQQRLQVVNSHGLVDLGTSFLDVTPMTDDVMFAAFLDAILADPGVDCAFIGMIPHIENLKTTDDCCREPDAVAPLIIEVVNRHKKPVVMSINSGNHYQELVKCFEEEGIPVFSDIRSALKALDTFVSWHIKKKQCEL